MPEVSLARRTCKTRLGQTSRAMMRTSTTSWTSLTMKVVLMISLKATRRYRHMLCAHLCRHVPYLHFHHCCQAHKTLCEREGKHTDSPKGRLFYLALPPSVYPEVVQGIKENCTDVDVGDGGFLRIIAEKPFGKVISLCTLSFQSTEQIHQQPACVSKHSLTQPAACVLLDLGGIKHVSRSRQLMLRQLLAVHDITHGP